jgi:transposase-like protein
MQVIEVFVTKSRHVVSARRIFTTALAAHIAPTRVTTDRAPDLANVIEGLIPAATLGTDQSENNRCECHHGGTKARPLPMRGLMTDRTASVASRVRAFVQNLRRVPDEHGVVASPMFRLATAFVEIQRAICSIPPRPTIPHAL